MCGRIFILYGIYRYIIQIPVWFKEALHDVIMADIRSKRHFWSEMIRFFYRQIHYRPLVLEFFCKTV